MPDYNDKFENFEKEIPVPKVSLFGSLIIAWWDYKEYLLGIREWRAFNNEYHQHDK
jgi:hypothetical protein